MARPKKSGPPPWHMWGNTQTITLQVQALGSEWSKISTQLLNVRYARPDSFYFFFCAKLVQLATLDGGYVNVDFIVSSGVGRSNVTVDPFERFRWQLNPVVFPLPPKYSNSVLCPPRNDFVPGDPRPNQIDRICAQDIQASCVVSMMGDTVLTNVLTVEVSAYFVPLSHFRPEWLRGEFAWGEDDGK